MDEVSEFRRSVSEILGSSRAFQNLLAAAQVTAGGVEDWTVFGHDVSSGLCRFWRGPRVIVQVMVFRPENRVCVSSYVPNHVTRQLYTMQTHLDLDDRRWGLDEGLSTLIWWHV